MIITTPFSPSEFYYEMKNDSTDAGYQLYRRLTTVLRFDMNYIYEERYYEDTGKYSAFRKKINEYSEQHSDSEKVAVEDIFGLLEGDEVQTYPEQQTCWTELDEEYAEYFPF